MHSLEGWREKLEVWLQREEIRLRPEETNSLAVVGTEAEGLPQEGLGSRVYKGGLSAVSEEPDVNQEGAKGVGHLTQEECLQC